MKENPAFQTISIELYKQAKAKSKKEHIRLAIISIGVHVVAKTDDEVYVLSIIKIYSFYLFPLLCQRRPNCWKYQTWCSYFENLYADAKIVDKERLNFWSVLTVPCCFSEKKLSSFLKRLWYLSIAVVWLVTLGSREDICLKILLILCGCLLGCRKRQLKQNVNFVQVFYISTIWLP